MALLYLLLKVQYPLLHTVSKLTKNITNIRKHMYKTHADIDISFELNLMFLK